MNTKPDSTREGKQKETERFRQVVGDIKADHGSNGNKSPANVRRPTIYHPQGRLESETHTEMGRIIARKNAWFLRGPDIVTIERIPSGFEYAEDEDAKYKIVSYTSGVAELTGLSAKSHLEQYMIPTVRRLNDDNEFVDRPKSFSAAFCSAAPQSVFLRRRLSHINRILTVPLPFRVPGSNRLIYPKSGYDKRFGTYLVTRTSRAPFNAMLTWPTGALSKSTNAISPWQDAGPTRGATSTMRASKLRSVADGSYARSAISTASRKTCAAARQAHGNAPLCA